MAKHLYCCDYYVVVQCLCYTTKLDSPMFHNLAFLYLKAEACLWRVLPLLLHRAPNLAVLVFEKVCYAQMMKCLFFSNNPELI